MARIPKYPFRVIVTRVAGTDNLLRQEAHNYETLPGAWGYRDIMLRRPSTRHVQIVMVLDESTPTHSEAPESDRPPNHLNRR